MKQWLLVWALVACGQKGSSAPPSVDARPCPACPEVPAPRYDVILVDPGADRVEVIKRVRELTGRSLESATKLVDAAPVVVKQNVDKTLAAELEQRFEQVGATVDVD